MLFSSVRSQSVAYPFLRILHIVILYTEKKAFVLVLKRNQNKNPKTIYILTTMGSRKNYKASVEVGSEVFH